MTNEEIKYKCEINKGKFHTLLFDNKPKHKIS